MDNNEKGLLYEIQIRNHIRNSLNKQAYLWVNFTKKYPNYFRL